jgi:hypothetical protein
MTPTEGFPGSPTIAIGIVITPRFATPETGEAEVVLVVDDLLLVHPAATTENAATVPMSANR